MRPRNGHLIPRSGGNVRRALRTGVATIALVSAWVAIGGHPASAATLPPNCAGDIHVVSCTFSYNGTTGADGSPQSFTVPSGVGQVAIEAWGAQGGTATTQDDVFAQPAVGGLGGYAKGTIPVTAGDVLFVTVGGQPTGASGGYNGGGAAGAGTSTYFAEPGGGATDVREGGNALADRVAVAGGGGGAAFDANLDHGDALGGAGGGSSGAASVFCPNDGFLSTCGGGATTSAAGAAGSPAASCATGGALGLGGSGCGGGGGGGYFGGGGGGFYDGSGAVTTSIDGPGGGGSGYLTAAATGVATLGDRQYGNGLVRISYVAHHRYPGLSWSKPKRIATRKSALSAVSCASATFCVAVDAAGDAITYDGAWSKPTAAAAANLVAVSCPSRTFCVAVGSVTATDGESTPVIATDSNGSWTSTTGPVSGTPEVLNSVSCLSATFCVAAGTYQQSGAPGTSAFVQTFDGHSWTAVMDQELIGYASGDSMLGVSCASPSFCAAAGVAGDRSDIGGLVDVDTDGSWVGAQISDDRTGDFSSYGGLSAIACSAVNECLAAGPAGYVFNFDGSGWTAADADHVSAIAAVACSDASTCLGVDDAGNVVVNQNGIWEAPQSIDQGHRMMSLSCPTTRFCAAVDSVGEVTIGS